jgi:hypothetical protein
MINHVLERPKTATTPEIANEIRDVVFWQIAE